MQQTFSEVVDASAAATVVRNYVLTGGVSDDLIAALISVVSTGNAPPNDELDISVSVSGLGGNDELATTINLANDNFETGGDGETISSRIDGGTGDDTITGAINLSYYWGDVSNEALGGDGEDTIRLSIQYTDYNDSSGGNLVQSFADGGDDADFIEVRTVMGEAESTTEPISHVLYGGDGRDTIISHVHATSNDGDSANVLIFGGRGSDNIDAYMQLDEGDSHGVTEIHGGNGNDTVVAEVFNAFFGGEDYTVDVSLFGDGGKDRLTSRMNLDALLDAGADVDSSAILTGGGGADTLVSEGGNASNHNTFDGGSGNDKMFGDGSVDEFVFIAGINQGSDQIHNWDGSMDLLNISGLSNGAIDAQSSIASAGADVVLTLDSGTVITFKNVGIAGVDSVDDLFWIGA